uniref:Uncharacterized protein n=1 Tax=Pundamilia nyererei TaxID=303518 RepID=A0A3B4F462_9CICH
MSMIRMIEAYHKHVSFGPFSHEEQQQIRSLIDKTATDLAGVIFPAFSGNRLNLEKHMLKSLAEKEDFDDFITYFTYPRTQEVTFIKAEVQKYITDHNDEALNILKKIGNTDMWMKEFSNALKDELTFDNICFENFSDIKHFDFLKEEIKKGFKSITEHHLSLEKLNESSLKAEEFLIDQLCNCSWVTCPFCAAACTNTMKAHSPYDHTTPFHQLSVISGEHWGHTSESGMHVCTELFSSNYSFYPYHYSGRSTPDKQYRSAGSQYCTWRIPSDGSQAYWKWFVCRFQHELERHYDFKFQGRQEIPHQWKTVSKYELKKLQTC